MAIRACETKILVNEFDFSGDTNAVTLNSDIGVIEYSVLQNCAVLKLPNLVTPAITHNGYYSAPDAGELEAEMYDALDAANNVYVAVIFGTRLTAPVAYVLPATFNQQLRLDAPLTELLTVNGNWPGGTERMYRGLQVANGVAVDSTGSLTGVDFGAGGSAGGKAFVFVTDIGGSGTDIDITIQSDSASDFSGAASEGVATFSDVGVVEVDLSGTVGRYVRANLTDLGGADDVTFVMIVALAGVSY